MSPDAFKNFVNLRSGVSFNTCILLPRKNESKEQRAHLLSLPRAAPGRVSRRSVLGDAPEKLVPVQDQDDSAGINV